MSLMPPPGGPLPGPAGPGPRPSPAGGTPGDASAAPTVRLMAPASDEMLTAAMAAAQVGQPLSLHITGTVTQVLPGGPDGPLLELTPESVQVAPPGPMAEPGAPVGPPGLPMPSPAPAGNLVAMLRGQRPPRGLG